MFWKLAEGLLAKETIMIYPVDVRDSGLEGVLRGLDETRQGRVLGLCIRRWAGSLDQGSPVRVKGRGYKL